MMDWMVHIREMWIWSRGGGKSQVSKKIPIHKI